MNEFDLITLTVSLTEARMLATAASVRGMHFAGKSSSDQSPVAEYDLNAYARQSRAYTDLAAKVDRQRQL